MKRSRLLLPLAILAVLTCQDDKLPTALSVPPPFLEINDGHSTATLNPHFVFLFPIRPLTAQPPTDEAFNPELQPVVKICKWNGSACGAPEFELTMTSGTIVTLDGVVVRLGGIVVYPDLEKYLAAWNTVGLGLRRDESYRIRVLVEARELGFVDAKVVETIRQLLAVDRSQYVPLLKNSILPIPFWIGERAMFVIGPTGGTITAVGGAVSITVGENALAANTEITIEPLTSPPPGDGVLIAEGTAYDFGPDGLTFDPPAQLTIAYDEAQLPPGTLEHTLTLLHFVNGSWQGVAGSTVNTEANSVTGSVTGFSEYAVGSLPLVTLAVLEAVVVSDAPGLLPPAIVTVTEAIQLTDAVKALLPVALAVTEHITVSDLQAVVPPIQVSVSETVVVSDGPGVLLPVQVSVSEAVGVSDRLGVLPPVQLSVVEAVAVSDRSSVLPPIIITVRESITATDVVQVAAN